MFLWRNKENYPLIITKYPPDLFHWLLISFFDYCRPEDKKSLSGESSKSSSSLSLSKSSDSALEKVVTSIKPPVLETEIGGTDPKERRESLPNLMSQSMIVTETKHSSLEHNVRLSVGSASELKRQTSSPETLLDTSKLSSSDDLKSMDNVLAEIMSDVRSLELQQSTEKRMSLPLVKTKTAAKHTPDLVLDLPEDSNSPSPSEGSGPDSPVSAAETFAKSNQGTLKKAASMPRNIPSSDIHVFSSEISVNTEPQMITAPLMSSFHQAKQKSTTLPATSRPPPTRKFSIEEKLLTTSSRETFHSFSPPIAEKPKPQIKPKPPIMKKPVSKSPELSKRSEQTNVDSERANSASPSLKWNTKANKKKSHE